MKPIFYPNEYRPAAFSATFARLLRWLRGSSPPLFYNSNTFTKPLRISGINSLNQTFGSGSYTIVLPIFCVLSSIVYYSSLGKAIFCAVLYTYIITTQVILITTYSYEMIFKIQLLSPFKKII